VGDADLAVFFSLVVVSFADFVFFAVVVVVGDFVVFAADAPDLPFGAVAVPFTFVFVGPDLADVGLTVGPFAATGAAAFGPCVGLAAEACGFGAFDAPRPFPWAISDTLDSRNNTAVAAMAIFARIYRSLPRGRSSPLAGRAQGVFRFFGEAQPSEGQTLARELTRSGATDGLRP
jgi:hypothetical protein